MNFRSSNDGFKPFKCYPKNFNTFDSFAPTNNSLYQTSFVQQPDLFTHVEDPQQSSIILKNGLTFNLINRNLPQQSNKNFYDRMPNPHPNFTPNSLHNFTPNSNFSNFSCNASSYFSPVMNSSQMQFPPANHELSPSISFFSPQIFQTSYSMANFDVPNDNFGMHNSYFTQDGVRGKSPSFDIFNNNEFSPSKKMEFFPMTPQNYEKTNAVHTKIDTAPTSTSTLSTPVQKIGAYTIEERKQRIQHYKQKQVKWREHHPIKRNFNGRKLVAENKPRVKGKFVKTVPVELNSAQQAGEKIEPNQVMKI